MTHYYYTVKNSAERGYNTVVEVYEIDMKGDFVFIGLSNEHTRAWKGSRAVVASILHINKKHKLDKGGYNLLSRNIVLHEVP